MQMPLTAQQPHSPIQKGFIPHNMVTTAFTIPSTKIIRSMGIVRGITVRSRSVVGNMAASFQMLFGGNISIYSNLCEQAREDAFDIMVQHASLLGANAVIGLRYDATEIMAGVTEVLCYGTAVFMEPEQQGERV